MTEQVESKGFKIETSSLRAYTMLGALILIWLFFHWQTGGTFLSSGNLSNLMLQTSVTGILAVGMLMLIIAGQIDLSVGSVLALAGGSAALVMVDPANKAWGFIFLIQCVLLAGVLWLLKILSKGNFWQTLLIGLLGISFAIGAPYLLSNQISPLSAFIPTIMVAMLTAIAVGIYIGLIHGVLTAYGKIPAFIVTLGGLLAWRGAIKGVSHSETVSVADPTFKMFGQGNLTLASGWVLGGIAIAAVLFMAYRRAKSQKDYGLGEADYAREFIKTILPIIGISGFVFAMNSSGDNNTMGGVPLPVLVFIIVAIFGSFITNSTTFGRYLYAIGGNSDAARLSGIDTKLNILKVYMLLGVLTGIAAIVFTARQGSATPDAGTLKELEAIAACVIGGASLMGGRGTVFGACLGALIMASLDNGMSLLNYSDFVQEIIKGSILVAAVGVDMIGRKS